jgi:hypothetical protein
MGHTSMAWLPVVGMLATSEVGTLLHATGLDGQLRAFHSVDAALRGMGSR